MHRRYIGMLLLMIAILFGISFGIAAKEMQEDKKDMEDMTVPMGIIVLEPDKSITPKKAPVEFHHSKHFIYDCKTCHHKWQGNAQVAGCTTSDCHDQLESPKKPTKYLSYTETGIKYYKYAYHQKCVGCHKEEKDKRKKMEMSLTVVKDKLPKTGPTGCIECHPNVEE
jgi:hypothetical protein